MDELSKLLDDSRDYELYESMNLESETKHLKLEEIIALKFQCRLIMMVVATMIVLKIMMGVQLHSHARGAVVTSKQMIPPCCPVSLILLWAIFSATGDAELDQEWLLRL